MKNTHTFVAKTRKPIHDREHSIYIGVGATIVLSFASRPMILALRKKYLQDRRAFRISKRSKRYLFTFPGFISLDEPYF